MAADGEGNVIDIAPRKSSLMDAISRAAKAQSAAPMPPPAENQPERASEAGEESPPAADDFSTLPRAGDAYQAYSRPSNKPVPTLHCLLADGSRRGFSWGNFDSIDSINGEKAGDPPLTVLRFAGMVNVEIVFAGRHLATLYDYLGYQRVAWIRELPKGKLTDPKLPAITGLLVRKIDANPY